MSKEQSYKSAAGAILELLEDELPEMELVLRNMRNSTYCRTQGLGQTYGTFFLDENELKHKITEIIKEWL